jgi:Arc/MetJ-type ribon-helix-helix transcriptional regulator
MNQALTPYCKRIIRPQIATGRFADKGEVMRYSLRLADALERGAGPQGGSFAGREDLEGLLLEGLDSVASVAMTPARKKRIYRRALERD